MGRQAATNANDYFTNLIKTLRDQIDALHGIAGQFHALAAGMREMAQPLQSLCQDLMDWLIAIAISAAASAASSWTVVGGIAGGIATVAAIYEAIKTWLMIIDAHDAAWATVQGITGLMAGYLGGLQGMKKHELTNAAYNHPGV
jgi:phage-related minor tail protein